MDTGGDERGVQAVWGVQALSDRDQRQREKQLDFHDLASNTTTTTNTTCLNDDMDVGRDSFSWMPRGGSRLVLSLSVR